MISVVVRVNLHLRKTLIARNQSHLGSAGANYVAGRLAALI